MRKTGLLAAVLLAALPVFAHADAFSDRLDGTWIQTIQIKDSPRAVLHFDGQKLHFENLYATAATVEYKVIEQGKKDFVINFEYHHQVERGKGRFIDATETRDIRYHVENGLPILSERVYELDGRGEIVWKEYLRKENFTDGFESELRKKLNNREAVPTMMKME